MINDQDDVTMKNYLSHIKAGHSLENIAHPIVEDAVHVVAVTLGHARHTLREKLYFYLR